IGPQAASNRRSRRRAARRREALKSAGRMAAIEPDSKGTAPLRADGAATAPDPTARWTRFAFPDDSRSGRFGDRVDTVQACHREVNGWKYLSRPAKSVLTEMIESGLVAARSNLGSGSPGTIGRPVGRART